MNILSAILFVSLSFINGFICSQFCSVNTFDNVFNLGQFVYLVRFGEVWTFDPRMNGGDGGFLRDYTIYGFGRHLFMDEMVKRDKYFDERYFRFSVFFFSELKCIHTNPTIGPFCERAIDKWNYFGVISGNKTSFPFHYEYDLKYVPSNPNPLRMRWESHQTINLTELTETNVRFWPLISKVTQELYDFQYSDGHIHSTLFSPEELILYLVIRIENDKTYCLTYTEMEDNHFDISLNPGIGKASPHSIRINYTTFYKWSNSLCFDGRVIGMFYDEREKRAYLSGHMTDDKLYDDQIYIMVAPKKSRKPELLPLFHKPNERLDDKERGTLHNLRTYFGCDLKLNPTESEKRRSKRSIQEKQKGKTTQRFSSEYDFIQLSLMSFIAVVLIFVLYIFQKF